MLEREKSKKLISVVIPIFNAERYLASCLTSIQNQTYPNYEVILVNDGSTDSSREICLEFCKHNQHFHLIEQKNSGLSISRNRGVEKAIGEYVCFVDADDIVSKELLQVQYDNIEKYQADIAICNYVKFENESELETIEENDNNPRLIEKRQLLFDISTTGEGNKSERIVIACSKLIRKHIVEKIKFPEKMWHEDEYVIHQYIDIANRIVISDKILYYYRQHSQSFMHDKVVNVQGHMDILKAFEHRIRTIQKYNDRELLHAVVKAYLENATIYYLLTEIDERWKKKCIFPKIIKTILRYCFVLQPWELKRYLFFLLSPTRYRKRFWK